MSSTETFLNRALQQERSRKQKTKLFRLIYSDGRSIPPSRVNLRGTRIRKGHGSALSMRFLLRSANAAGHFRDRLPTPLETMRTMKMRAVERENQSVKR